MHNDAELQQKMMEVQKKLNSLEAEGSSGTGDLAVKITMNGKYEATKVEISPELIKQTPEALNDLVASAITDAAHSTEKLIQTEMMALMAGFQQPS